MLDSPLNQLHQYGQSFWYDSLSREMIANGELNRMIQKEGLRGITSNPTIFHQAVSESGRYDDTIVREARQGKTNEQIFDVIAREDIQAACDLLKPVYDRCGGTDGFVSLEVSPHLAHDTNASIREGHRLHELVDRPNLLVKVPATAEGIPAIHGLLIDGVNVNITLMFSQNNYDAVAEAYILALEERRRRGQPLDNIASVASMFVSRIDTKVDAWIDAMVNEGQDPAQSDALKLRGEFAIANARLCYQRYRSHFESPRFRALEDAGARRQRVLFASTSTKDPAYPDTYYVDALIGPNTVVTMAPATVPAFKDHGIASYTVEKGVDRAEKAFQEAGRLGIDLDRAMLELQEEGVEKFAESLDALLEAVAKKRERLAVSSA